MIGYFLVMNSRRSNRGIHYSSFSCRSYGVVIDFVKFSSSASIGVGEASLRVFSTFRLNINCLQNLSFRVYSSSVNC